ncbi:MULTISPECIES: aminotransferase class I/II-fold pyridoxal phosphate-dependent enzyme [Sutcliffiella]|uniref:Arginine decarboxylase n=1 Tax=Sutcliffiella cohnii TaxID=33932 RepID=A0A223KX20_9BACI|nr:MULTISPECIES: aminotransferase class I/II-fold pyridoxal phosphate-dependent enzyme [Sutcliffiella]AST93957.1 arginine decarboxylase [Sutcliffiella cohnii]MED4018440.1 aminotransferase class I/II-fold pyridoxal phosphate-dependent enzyme [Sutcliffiella cohnii]WBL15160.1 aminotransferase class I/II-fold pyridoxal phosphate-dependent enzyme [Sutcliffiella sp. NC1]
MNSKSKNDIDTPIFSTLMNHFEKKPISGHVPGHKYGTVFPKEGRRFFDNILKIDATEITGLDDLHDPQGIIKEAQQLTAQLYGSERTYFLVNGSTVGNIAMILANCERGSKVLVQRNCHKSILNGIELAGAEPIFIMPEYNQMIGVSTSITLESLEEALDQYNNVSGLIITNPNYYGLTVPLTKIIEKAHDYNIPVLVDEAHGAHFVIGDPFPSSAIRCGADIVIHSAHKTLPAMTMGSFLHMQGNLVNRDRVEYYLRMLQSSSPSYPIMASLDLARAYISNFREQSSLLIEKINNLKEEISTIEEIEIVESEENVKMDPLKIILRSTVGLSGYQLQSLLESENIFPELADLQNVLFILPLSTEEHFHGMINKIRKAVHLKGDNRKESPNPLNFVDKSIRKLSTLHIPLDKQYMFRKVECDLLQSEGKVSAETIVPYPPGIPVLYKGEVITKEIIEYITTLSEQGAKLQGKELAKYRKIYVFYIEKELHQ